MGTLVEVDDDALRLSFDDASGFDELAVELFGWRLVEAAQLPLATTVVATSTSTFSPRIIALAAGSLRGRKILPQIALITRNAAERNGSHFHRHRVRRVAVCKACNGSHAAKAPESALAEVKKSYLT